MWFPDRHLLARFALDEVQPKTIQVLDGSPSHAVGRIQKAAQFEGKRFLSCGNVGDFGFDDKFTFSCWIYPQGSRGGAIVSRMLETEHANGYGFHLVDGKLQLNLVVRWLDDSLRVETERKLETDRWHHVAVSYDGSRVSNGVKFYVDGKPEKLCIHLDDLNQSFKNLEPLRIGSGGGAGSRFQGLIDEVRIYSAALLPATIELLAQPESIGELLTVPMEKRTHAQAAKLRAYFLEQHGAGRYSQGISGRHRLAGKNGGNGREFSNRHGHGRNADSSRVSHSRSWRVQQAGSQSFAGCSGSVSAVADQNSK